MKELKNAVILEVTSGIKEEPKKLLKDMYILMIMKMR